MPRKKSIITKQNIKPKRKIIKNKKVIDNKRQRMTGIVEMHMGKRPIPMKLSSSELRQGYVVYRDMQGMGRSVFYGQHEKGLKFKSDIEKQQYYKQKQKQRIEKVQSYNKRKDFYDRQSELSYERTRLGQRRNEYEIGGRTLIVQDKATGTLIKKHYPGVFEKSPAIYGETRSLSGELYEPEVNRKEFKNLSSREQRLLPRTLEQARAARTFQEVKEDREYNPRAQDLGLQDVTPKSEDERFKYKNKAYKPMKLDKNTLDINRAMVTDKEASYFRDERISKAKLGKGMKKNYSAERQQEILNDIKVAEGMEKLHNKQIKEQLKEESRMRKEERDNRIIDTGSSSSSSSSSYESPTEYKEDKKTRTTFKNTMEDLGIESV
jgi:hypothetical protein